MPGRALRLSKKSVIVKIDSQFYGFFSLDFIYKSGWIPMPILCNINQRKS